MTETTVPKILAAGATAEEIPAAGIPVAEASGSRLASRSRGQNPLAAGMLELRPAPLLTSGAPLPDPWQADHADLADPRP